METREPPPSEHFTFPAYCGFHRSISSTSRFLRQCFQEVSTLRSSSSILFLRFKFFLDILFLIISYMMTSICTYFYLRDDYGLVLLLLFFFNKKSVFISSSVHRFVVAIRLSFCFWFVYFLFKWKIFDCLFVGKISRFTHLFMRWVVL